jgi:hypothetical protein
MLRGESFSQNVNAKSSIVIQTVFTANVTHFHEVSEKDKSLISTTAPYAEISAGSSDLRVHSKTEYGRLKERPYSVLIIAFAVKSHSARSA